MSLSFFLKTGQRTLVSILPEVRNLAFGKFTGTKNFHSVCDNNRNNTSRLLAAVQNSLIDTVRGLKTKGKLNLRCKDCYFVIRQGRKYVMCKSHGRHKQELIAPKEKDTWIYTHNMQCRVRPY